MKLQLSLFSLLSLLTVSEAQEMAIHLSDGRVIQSRQMRRERDTIIAAIETKMPDGTTKRADIGFPLKDIHKLDFPRPDVLDTAPELIATGQAAKALEALEPAVKFYSGFQDAPGSWWVNLVPLQLQALLAQKKYDEAGQVAASFARMATSPDIKQLTRAFTALSLTRRGEHEAALPLYDDAAKATKMPDMLGMIAVNKGDSLLALAEAEKTKGEIEKAFVRYEEALLSYLRIPALFPSQRMYMPQVTYGAARAYLGMDDFERAQTSIKELRELYASTPEAAGANDLETQLNKRKALIAAPTEPAKN